MRGVAQTAVRLRIVVLFARIVKVYCAFDDAINLDLEFSEIGVAYANYLYRCARKRKRHVLVGRVVDSIAAAACRGIADGAPTVIHDIGTRIINYRHRRCRGRRKGRGARRCFGSGLRWRTR